MNIIILGSSLTSNANIQSALAVQSSQTVSIKTFRKDLWQKKKCFHPIIANMFDQASDIGVIFGLYHLIVEEQRDKNTCVNVNPFYLLILSLTFFLFYRIVSGIAVFVGTKNIWYSFGQFLFEFMLYRAVWVNYILECDEPCSPQRWLQNMESMLEAFPQLIIQMYFLVQTQDESKSDSNNNNNNNNNGSQFFIIFSIIFSMISMTNKVVSEDKPLFNSEWQHPGWKCKLRFIKNEKYLFRLFFRIFDISSRITIIVLVWSVFGGQIIFIAGGIEFTLLFIIAIISKELSQKNILFLL